VECEGKLIGSMIKYKLQAKIFEHVLTEGSILIDPDFQGKGIGSKLITIFLSVIEKKHPEIARIELIARESNPAIKLYEKLGFKKEGRFENRVRGINGGLEADIPMAWFNSHYTNTEKNNLID
jgi:ribosomal protein S18 acetylase RimI-like enzyme